MTALYLKYRPKDIDELDLTSVRDSLSQIVKSGKIPHAFLFSGPKGTGKTSAARIIAKLVNCEGRKKGVVNPCNKCESCKLIDRGRSLDILELDAASHRGIDDVRALREAVKLSPTSSKKKIYIVDEAHMLTTEASNALLKTLEEPPDHVIFVLATTNPEKLIPTIRSRTTNIIFNKAKKEELARSLERVVKGEKLKAEKKALDIIAGVSDGSFRDAVKSLEQFVSQGGKLKEDEVKKFIYGSAFAGTERVLSLLQERNVKKTLEEIEKVVSGGLSARSFLENVLSEIRKSLLAKAGIGEDTLTSFSREELVDLTELLLEAEKNTSTTFIEQLPFELAVIKWCEGRSEGTPERAEEEEKKVPDPAETKKSLKINSPKEVKEAISLPVLKPNSKSLDEDIWKKILELIRPKNSSTEALLRAAKPLQFDGKNLTLGVFYSFHKEHLEGNFHRTLLEEVVETVLGAKVKISCLLTEPPPRKVIEKAEKEPVLTEGSDEDIVKVAEEIFGN